MPRKFIDPKKAQHFQLVFKSQEDPTYENDKTAGVLMKSARIGKRKVRTGYESRILDEDIKFNMHNEDDAVDPGLFDDEVEADFDQDFIEQMMMPGEGEEEEDEEEPDEYPRHEHSRDMDKDFDGLMKAEYRPAQMEVDEEDPRAEGALPAEAYVPAMQEVNVRQQLEKFSLIPREGHKRPDLAGGLRATGEEVFHQDLQGRFMTVLKSKKDVDIIENWEEEEAESRYVALEFVKAANARGLDVAAGKEEDYDETARDQYEYIRVRQKPEEKWDCNTVLSTLSTLENRPSVIPTESKRIKIVKGRPVFVDRTRLTAKALQRLEDEQPAESPAVEQAAEPAAAPGSEVGSQLKDLECVRKTGALSEEEFQQAKERIIARSSAAGESADHAALAELDCGESMVTVYDTSAGRPKNEDPAQKKLRKQAARDEKAAKREQKKALKTAYKAETIKARYVAPQARQQRAQLSL